MNLGSPDSTEVKDVKRYLDEFLMDKRVIDYPYLFRLLLVKGLITPKRSHASAEAYKTIWTKEGSPLIVLTKQLQQALQQKLVEPIEIAMRYGHPTPAAAFDALLEKHPGLEEVIAIPLYPHYAMASYETAVEFAKEWYHKNRYSFKLSFIKPFYNEANYIHAMVENMRPYLTEAYDHILFSYHGIPARHIRKVDPGHPPIVHNHTDCCTGNIASQKTCYRHQCFETTRLITQALQIPTEKHSIAFQSRLGKGWLEPFTDVRLQQLPKEGIKKLLILSPAFISDCLETLEELEERGKETFMQAGGESYKMIPCLNVHPLWVDTLEKWVVDIRNEDREMIF